MRLCFIGDASAISFSSSLHAFTSLYFFFWLKQQISRSIIYGGVDLRAGIFFVKAKSSRLTRGHRFVVISRQLVN
jgi:hypothetical protein